MSLDPIRCTSDDNRSWQAEPLSSDRYAECVEIYEAASNQRRLLQQSLTNQIGDAYAGRALRMLSVGSGSGEFDAGVLEHLAPRLGPIDYTGIDPIRISASWPGRGGATRRRRQRCLRALAAARSVRRNTKGYKY